MRLLSRSLVGAVTTSVVFVVAAIAWAETCTLEVKRLDDQGRTTTDYSYRATYPQSFFVQKMKNAMHSGNPQQAEAFKRIVTKEPKYQSETPFRGVAKLGSQEFAFVLDAVPPPAKEAKPDAEKAKEKEKATVGKADSAAGKPAEKEKSVKTPPVEIYNRLHFDLNHNGDLTDDKVVEVPANGVQRISQSARQSYAMFRFPRVDLKVDNDGIESDYSFFMDGHVVSSPDFSYTSVSLNAGAYRQGDITIDGKKRHVALIDFNSNGRFGDEIKLVTVMVGRGGKPVSESRPNQGDMLLIDPVAGRDSPYDVTNSDSRNYVSRMVCIDGRFYDMKMSPAGDKLTLEASSLPVGKVTNPNGAFRAVVYSEGGGFLKVRGNKDTPAVLPEGEWRLVSYTIECTEAEKPKKAEEKKAETKDLPKDPLSKGLQALLSGPASPGGRNLPSVVTAEVGGEYKPVKVVKEETVTLPFGPPYKPTVTAEYFQDGNQRKMLSLGLSLIGSAGETCSNMTVNGSRPSTPKFTITDDKGKVIQQGSFEYG